MEEKFIEQIVSDVTAEYEKIRSERKSMELQWRLNMNYLAGNQYCEISPMGDIEDFGKQYFWQQREVYNHIAPIIETRLAKLGRVKASVSVRPFSNDESDINAAKLSTRVLQAITDENDLSALISRACMWGEVCGSCFYKVIWNGDKGIEVGKDSKNRSVREGDVEISVCSPFEIFPDNLAAADIDDCKSIIHAKAYTVTEIEDIWGVRCAGSSIDVFGMDSVGGAGGLGYAANMPKIGGIKRDGCVVVLEKFERPSTAYPNGRHIIVAEDKLLHYGELPYITDKEDVRGLPFVRQSAIDNVGSIYGESIIERIIPLQRTYNSIKNRKHEFLNRIAMGVLAVEDGSVDTDNLEEEGLSPGKVLVYRQGCNPPRMLEMGSVPNDFTIEESRLENEFVTISGVSEFMRYSKLPDNVTSGIAISLVQEQDDTRISMTAESIRQAVKRIGQIILRLYRQYAKTKRLKRIAGDNGEIQLHYFVGSDLAGEDIVFDTDNELSQTPANRRSMVFELIKMGLLHDENGRINPRMKVKILEMLGLGNWENGRDIDECHVNKAVRENLHMKDKDIDILEMDDHMIHIMEHTKALVSEDNNKKYSQRLIAHIKAHELMSSMKGEDNERM